MRLIILSLTVPLISFYHVKGQDTISIIGTGPLQVKVLEIAPKEVKYKLYDNQTGPIYTVVKSAVEFIHYENGSRENLSLGAPSGTATPEVSPESGIEWAAKGRDDAILYYSGRHTGSFWVGSATVLFTPLLGWIPALAVASFPPSEKNLNILDYRLRNNKSYYKSYLEQAHKIKKDKIWSTYGVVSLFFLEIAGN